MTSLLPAPPTVSFETTPIIPGFHPDPTICRVDGQYYLANSSFEYAPGIPIFVSNNLTDWQQVGNALTRPSQFAAGRRLPSRGIFAPTLRHHDGRFWLITTDVGSAAGGQMLFTATDPAGPWSDPVVIDVPGIDPDIAWDDFGDCYVTWCAPESTTTGIKQVRINPTTGELLEVPRSMWSGTGLAYPEGPHLYRRGSWWYLLVAEGGTERGHTVAIARSAQITGPFEAATRNPILSHRSTIHSVQNTGHADLVDRGDGNWAMVYLGVRPRGTSPLFHVNGRETFLASIDWKDDWPLVDEAGFTGHGIATDFDDEFTGILHSRWISAGGFPAEFTAPHPDGGLLLRPHWSPNGAPAALSTRATDSHWTASITLGHTAGRCEIVLRLDERHHCSIQVEQGTATAHLRIGPLAGPIGTSLHGVRGTVTAHLRSLPSKSGGPDDIELTLVVNDREHRLARFDGRYLSTEVAGGFTGRTIGVAAIAGPLRLLRFRYTAADPVIDEENA